MLKRPMLLEVDKFGVVVRRWNLKGFQSWIAVNQVCFLQILLSYLVESDFIMFLITQLSSLCHPYLFITLIVAFDPLNVPIIP